MLVILLFSGVDIASGVCSKPNDTYLPIPSSMNCEPWPSVNTPDALFVVTTVPALFSFVSVALAPKTLVCW